jgi:hypothetical protein
VGMRLARASSMTSRRQPPAEDREPIVDDFADDVPTRRFSTRRATTAEVTLVRALYPTTRPGWPPGF